MPRYLWMTHAALLLVAGFTVVTAFDSTPDANIGLGLGPLTLGALGAPWSLPVLLDDQISLGTWLFVGVAVGTAILNLVLHGLVARWWIARSPR